MQVFSEVGPLFANGFVQGFLRAPNEQQGFKLGVGAEQGKFGLIAKARINLEQLGPELFDVYAYRFFGMMGEYRIIAGMAVVDVCRRRRKQGFALF